MRTTRPTQLRLTLALAIYASACQQQEEQPNVDPDTDATCQTPASEDLFPHFNFSDVTEAGGNAAAGGQGPGAPPGGADPKAGGGASGGPTSGGGPSQGVGGAPTAAGRPAVSRPPEIEFNPEDPVAPPDRDIVPNRYGLAADQIMPDVLEELLWIDDFATTQPLGTNGRHCETCHSNDAEWSINPDALRARFFSGQRYLVSVPGDVSNDTATENDQLEPAFRTLDGANSPFADVSTPEARERAYSLLLSRAVFRIGLPVPEGADFELIEVDDPYGFASAAELSLFRRSPPMANLRFHTTLMFDGRETLACETLTNSLREQARTAIENHAQGEAPSDEAVANLTTAELGIYTAQLEHDLAGNLSEDGARGGPRALAQVPFYWGINSFAKEDPQGVPYSSEVFSLYSAWLDLEGETERERARARIARGEQVFNTRTFTVAGVSGFNDVLQREEITATCGACHNTPNVGTNSEGRLMDIGVSDGTRRSPELPLYTFRESSSGAIVRTTDPGEALVSGKWVHMNRLKVPSLRALAGRPPYFHDGSAPSLEAVVDYHDARFGIGLTAEERASLVAFLSAL